MIKWSTNEVNVLVPLKIVTVLVVVEAKISLLNCEILRAFQPFLNVC